MKATTAMTMTMKMMTVLAFSAAVLTGLSACDSASSDPADTAAGDTIGVDTTPPDDTMMPDTALPDDTGSPDDVGDMDGADHDTDLGPDTGQDTQLPVDTAMPEDTMTSQDTSGGLACPPPAPYGTGVGERLAPLELTRCDGTTLQLHDLCGKAVYLSAYAHWCPVCKGHAAEAEAKYQSFKALPGGDDFEMVFVITEGSGGDATADLCNVIKDDLGLSMEVVYDAAGSFPSHIGVTSTNAWYVALDSDHAVVAKTKYQQGDVFDAIDDLLQ